MTSSRGLGAAKVNDEEEEDYMSDALLAGISSQEPRSAPVPYTKRRAEKLRRQKESGTVKPLKEIERESRERGLQSQLPEENKGFQMLAKMGYKKGMSLGTAHTSQARVEPITVNLKQDRQGIGLADPVAIKRQRSEEQQRALEHEQEEARQDYRMLMNKRFAEKRLVADLRKARLQCEDLDRAKGLERNEFWFPEKRQTLVDDNGIPLEEEEEVPTEFESMEPSLQLMAVTIYLRTLHYYCLWCGEAYPTAEDLDNTCPGDTAESHDV
ncbi:hypothetical protein SpCBS45565_g00704 [Spizellomyces sp. 'palustris']|nr:hypothetical protein SpCBS45565_g00704 [Spizellomyces sp. 'palustris']